MAPVFGMFNADGGSYPDGYARLQNRFQMVARISDLRACAV